MNVSKEDVKVTGDSEKGETFKMEYRETKRQSQLGIGLHRLSVAMHFYYLKFLNAVKILPNI